MVNREIVIGGEKTWQGWSSLVCWDGANISQNSYGYLIHCDMFDCKMFILRGSELCLKYLTTDEIIQRINQLRDISHQMGYKEAQSDMRKALGL